MDFTEVFAEASRLLQWAWGAVDFGKLLSVVVTVGVFGLMIQVTKFLVLRLTAHRITEQSQMLLKKGFGYAGAAVLTMILFSTLGFDLTAVLGAAGIAGIAIGFAAQTSISNVISGLFLLSEKPFGIGDVIKFADVTGVVLSIDTMSVKIRTFDNTYVRIPNESLIKSTVINQTRFPIRRLDVVLTVPYTEDLSRVIQTLREVVASNKYALANPELFLNLKQFSLAGTDLSLGVWFDRADMTDLKNTLMVEILERFRAEGITMPRPCYTLG